MIEIRENGRYTELTQRRIDGIKNHSIRISIRGETKERIGEKFSKMGRTKNEIKNEIKLNYDPKLKIDDT